MKMLLKTNSVHRIQKSYAKFAVPQLESIFITVPEHASVVEVKNFIDPTMFGF